MAKRVDILPEITPNMSPMMRQYIDIKSRHLDSILFFRLGDFYEMFYNDARVASEELDLVLTKRANGEDEKADMCGIPFHSSEGYIARLVKKGYRVAICEQTEDPSKTKKLVKRDVIRIITPGTVTEDSMLEAGVNNYLASIFVDGENGGLCFADVSTGKLHLTQIESKRLEAEIINEITRFSPKEVLFNTQSAHFSQLYELVTNNLQSRIDLIDNELVDEMCETEVLNHFGALSFSSLGIEENSVSQKALCATMGFLFRTQKNDVAAINSIDIYSENKYMRLDMSSRTNLELTRTLRSQDKKGSLLWVLDNTKTPMGKRLIRNWIELPLLSPAEISRRQNAVGELLSKHEIREELNDALKEIKDLERLMTRVLYGTV
ncbi:MAG: DNA mismatch repair protein MutS, partial [Clostridia bacterium]|nr:DNA mismatch repair protein MutS [Clostridia bacterium]